MELKFQLPDDRNKLVSEQLLFNVNAAMFQPYHGVNKLIVNDMMMRTTLY